MPNQNGEHYWKIHKMNFAEALNAMRLGNKVSRESWRGKISYWWLHKRSGREYIHEVKPNGKTKVLVKIETKDIVANDWWIVT